MKKHVFIIILLGIIILGAFTVYASEEDPNEKPIESEIVYITDSVYYNKLTGLYGYPLNDSGDEVTSNVMDGMVTTGKVVINLPQSVNISVYRNGKEYTVEDRSVTKTGNYVVNYMNNGAVIQVMTFSVIKSETGKIESYRMPPYFSVDHVTLNGSEAAADRSFVDFTEEGHYIVEYSCTVTGVKYSLNLNIDHTAPVLKLEAVKNGSAEGPVDISDLEKGAKIVIRRNGKNVTPAEKLTKSGNYVIVVTDAAGNSNQYSFTIQVYFNTNSIVLFVLLIVGLAALIFYIYKSRTKLKVR